MTFDLIDGEVLIHKTESGVKARVECTTARHHQITRLGNFPYPNSITDQVLRDRRYSPGFFGEGASNDSGVVENGNFQRVRWLFLRNL